MSHATDEHEYDPEAREKEAQIAESVRKTLQLVADADLKWLMGSKQGRRHMWRLLERAGVFSLSFVPNAMQAAFNEGRRSIGLSWLGEIMENCPEGFTTMMQEHEAYAKRATERAARSGK